MSAPCIISFTTIMLHSRDVLFLSQSIISQSHWLAGILQTEGFSSTDYIFCVTWLKLMEFWQLAVATSFHSFPKWIISDTAENQWHIYRRFIFLSSKQSLIYVFPYNTVHCEPSCVLLHSQVTLPILVRTLDKKKYGWRESRTEMVQIKFHGILRTNTYSFSLSLSDQCRLQNKVHS